MHNQINQVVMLPELYKLLRQYQRLSYNPSTAISEFVDNSTESWFQNKDRLIENGIKGIQIDINYDKLLDRLIIFDSAYGMEIEDFKRAIILGSAPTKKTRNEYGFGLKTAACWFGSKWEVRSTQLNSPYKYSAIIDIDEIERTRTDSIDININNSSITEHYTEIIIQNVGSRMKDARLKSKIKRNIASKYRRDIKKGEIKIYYNGEPINYDEPEILIYKGEKKIKELDFSFNFKNKKYNVTGFVGIFARGTRTPYERSGFSLFTNDRTIIGDYKPENIFTKDPKSLIRGKLFGELNLNDIPVNQAKDNYIWSDGLEEELSKTLKENIQDFIDIASKPFKDIEAEENKEEQEKTSYINNISNLVSNKTSNIIKESAINFTLEDLRHDEKNNDNKNDKQTNYDNKEYVLHFENSIGKQAYKIIFDNTITSAFQLENNIIKINPDNVYYKKSNNKSTYIKHCLSLAIIFADLKLVYNNSNIVTITTDIEKRFFETFYKLRD